MIEADPTLVAEPDHALAMSFGGSVPNTTQENLWPDQPEMPGTDAPSRLPVDILPPALRRQAQSVANAMQVPIDLTILQALGCLSAALAGSIEVEPRAGWLENVGLYIAVILPPASRKSPANAAMIEPVREWEKERTAKIAPALMKARDTVALRERALAMTIKSCADGKASEHEIDEARRQLTEAETAVPPSGRLLAGDTTPEEIVRLLAAQGERLAMLEPEPGPLQSLARYSDAVRLDEIKKAWSAETMLVDRVSRPPLRVERPSLTLCLLIQPGVLESLPDAAAFRHEGVLARFLWGCPDHMLGRRLTGANAPLLDRSASIEYGRVLRRLLDFEPPAGQDGRPVPYQMTLDGDALALLHDFEEEVERDLADGGRFEQVRDWAGKMVGQSVRVAALLAMARRAEDGSDLLAPIDWVSMDGGVRLLRELSSHALHTLNRRDDGTADLRYLLKRIRGLPQPTIALARRATEGRKSIGGNRDTVMSLLDDLADRGCLRFLQPPLSEGPGRPPSEIIELHPLLRRRTVVVEL
jgi:replicative DNA helicase